MNELKGRIPDLSTHNPQHLSVSLRRNYTFLLPSAREFPKEVLSREGWEKDGFP